MSKIIKHDGYSYQISGDVKFNESHTIYECDGIKFDKNNKENVRMLFVRKSAHEQDLNEYGNVSEICELPTRYSDDEFHKKYLKYKIENKDFNLYIVKAKPAEVSQPIIPPVEHENEDPPLERPKLIRNIIIIALLLFLLITILTKLMKYDKMYSKDDFSSNNDESSVSQSPTTETTIEATAQTTSTNDLGFVLGDVNGDGIFSEDDLNLMTSHLDPKNPLPEELIKIADVNGDGEFNHIDVREFKILLQGE